MSERRASPILLRGAKAIAAHLQMSARAVTAMHHQGALPTFRVGGAPVATAGALDDWIVLTRTGVLGGGVGSKFTGWPPPVPPLCHPEIFSR